MYNAAKLEAVVLATTTREIDDGRFNRFIIEQLSKCYSTDLDLVIIINNSSHSTDIIPIITSVLEKFKTIETYYIEIPEQDDIYTTNENLKYIPELGLSSGPNILFFTTMNYCQKYNTILLLETDCVLKPYCFKKLKSFIEFAGDFLIIGSSYAGSQKIKFDEITFHHINGVAIYRTGNSEFQNLIKNVKQDIINMVKRRQYGGSSYDYAIMAFLKKKVDEQHIKPGAINNPGNNKICFDLWKTIYRKLIKTNLILDFSPHIDKVLNISDIENIYPDFVILHKKT